MKMSYYLRLLSLVRLPALGSLRAPFLLVARGLLLALALLGFHAPAAQAQIPGTFCDGNPADLANFQTTYPIHGYSLDPANAAANTDNQFTQGSKDGSPISGWAWSSGSANAKGDLTNAGAALTGSNNCILRFFGDRTSNNGDASIGFWFFVSPVSTNASGTFSGTHTDGDLLILSDFTGGGTTPTITVYKWVNGGLVLQPANPAAYCADVNHVEYPVPAGLTYTASNGGKKYAPNLFYEGALDLCALGIASCFSTFLVETRNSQSITASLQDFALGSFNATPATPAATVVQPTCTTPTGTVNVTSPNSAYTYTLTKNGYSQNGTASGSGASYAVAFSLVPAGTYTLTARQGDCTATAPVVVNAQPPTPAIPAATVVQPTCTTATGMVNVTSPNSAYTYTLTKTGFSQTGAVSAGPPYAVACSLVPAGTYTLTATQGPCSSSAPVVVNAQPPTPATPAATVVQPTCTTATGTVNVTSPNSAYTYTLTKTGFSQTGAASAGPPYAVAFSLVPAGTYTLTVAQGTCTATKTVVVNTQPPTPATPAATVVQPTCTTATGTVNVTSPNSAYSYTLTLDGSNPVVSQTRTVSGSGTSYAVAFSLVPAGTYTLTATQGPCSSSAPVVVNASPSTPARPVVTLQEATICGTTATPTVTVSCPVAGLYRFKQPGKTDQTFTYSGSNGPVKFPVVPGIGGFSITVTTGISTADPNGCTSDPTTCDNYTSNSCSSSNIVAPISTTFARTGSIQTEAYPNPTGQDATINFSVPQTGRVVVQVYNALGAHVATLFDGEVPADEQRSVVLRGAGLAAGAYTYRVIANGKTKMNRVLLIK